MHFVVFKARLQGTNSLSETCARRKHMSHFTTPTGATISLPEVREDGSFLQTLGDHGQQARIRRVFRKLSKENPKGLCRLVVGENQSPRRIFDWVRVAAEKANANLMIVSAYPSGTGVVDGTERLTGGFEVIYSSDPAVPEGAIVSIHGITEASGL